MRSGEKTKLKQVRELFVLRVPPFIEGDSIYNQNDATSSQRHLKGIETAVAGA